MNFIVSANTDIGTTKATNQDSLTVKVINTVQGRMVFSVLCDGMGGLAKGEVASASVIHAFSEWAEKELPFLCQKPIEDSAIRSQWEKIVDSQNKKIKAYGDSLGIRLGTTVVALLVTQNRYYVLNIGDSRAYKLRGSIEQITKDHTFVAREVSLGNMTEEQAKVDSRRSVLLQCVGASDNIYPDMFFGDVLPDTMFMLCCDGLRHEVSAEEIYAYLQPGVNFDENTMNSYSLQLMELVKQRQERDNISVVLIRTF